MKTKGTIHTYQLPSPERNPGDLKEKRGSNKTHTVNLLDVFVYLFSFFETGSLHSPGCPGTHYIDQVGFEPIVILPLSPKD